MIQNNRSSTIQVINLGQNDRTNPPTFPWSYKLSLLYGPKHRRVHMVCMTVSTAYTVRTVTNNELLKLFTPYDT